MRWLPWIARLLFLGWILWLMGPVGVGVFLWFVLDPLFWALAGGMAASFVCMGVAVEMLAWWASGDGRFAWRDALWVAAGAAGVVAAASWEPLTLIGAALGVVGCLFFLKPADVAPGGEPAGKPPS